MHKMVKIKTGQDTMQLNIADNKILGQTLKIFLRKCPIT